MTNITPQDQMFLDCSQDAEGWLASLDSLEQEPLPELESRMQEAFIRLGRLLFTNIKDKTCVAQDKQIEPVDQVVTEI